ncbi:MFS transporter [Brachybacterium sp. GU-2]|uniref:MFS transporter n=1 Tax=Brachybacterium sp. GU-2 TaxID=3069708 RepID=UPI00298C4C88|nr:MFS transporter [Brachybacterium sp. GU-2]WME22389.2 MFS transporter [Brachybacterium sp. GU-2]
MTAASIPATGTRALPPEGRAALRAGVVGNFIDNIHVFLPVTALAPAMLVIAGPSATASAAALIIVAMLLGRPVGGVVFGRIADRMGRTRTTRLAIAGTAACALAIALVPTHQVLGPGTVALILALRFLGGIFVAGEYSAAIPLAMEWSRPGRRGLMSGLILSMAPWAQATIAFAVAALLAMLGPEQYAVWGWRALFVAGAALSISMMLYYRRHVVDAPQARRAPASAAPSAPRPGLRSLLTGRWASAFWAAFVLMTGLWLLTDSTVLLLTARLSTDSPIAPEAVPLVMGAASIAQALVMVLAGHLSSLVGRRLLFVVWGAVAGLVGPVLWWAAVTAPTLAVAALLAALLQVATVSAYGPIASYLSERFPTAIRSTGYGSAYSLSLVLPALYPFYVPALEPLLGRHTTVMGMVALGGLLVVVGALLGPRLSPREIDADLDTVAERSTR